MLTDTIHKYQRSNTETLTDASKALVTRTHTAMMYTLHQIKMISDENSIAGSQSKT